MSHRDAISRLADRLDESVVWAVTGSANLALQGLPVEPGDVDVMTDAESAYRVTEAFPARVVRPVEPPDPAPDRRIRSHFGALELAGVTVEVMGAVEHRVDGEWVPTDDVEETREFLAVDGQQVPVMPLDHELAGYRELGRDERVALIEAHA